MDDYDDIHPLDNPEAIEVPAEPPVMPDNRTPEQVYDWLEAALSEETYPLLVSGFMLIDQVRFIDGAIHGHIAGTGDPEGFYDKELWVNLNNHNVRIIVSSEDLVTFTEPKDTPLAIFQYRCCWCGCAKTYSNKTAASKEGWVTVIDPLGSDWYFCPNPDCREKAMEYRELYDRLE